MRQHNNRHLAHNLVLGKSTTSRIISWVSNTISLARGILLKSTDNDKDSANFSHSSHLKERHLYKQEPSENNFLTLSLARLLFEAKRIPISLRTKAGFIEYLSDWL